MPGHLVNLLAPHYCCSCGEIGAVLCERCKYDIVSEPYEACILCHNIARPTENLCNSCTTAFSHAWVVGSRTSVLKKVIDDFKFERARAAYRVFSGLFDATLPNLPIDLVIVPIPTIAKHVRVRGYDHMRLIAEEFARTRTLAYSPCLYRATATMQRGASRTVRREQAERAFLTRNVCKGARYLIVDDVSTTGATLEYASRALLQAGAAEVWVAVLATQPLEKSHNI
jgi:ComF family protein